MCDLEVSKEYEGKALLIRVPLFHIYFEERLITCRVHHADMGGRWMQGSLRYTTGLMIGISDDVLQLEGACRRHETL